MRSGGAVRLGANYRFEDSANARSMRRRRRVAGKLRNDCPHIIEIEPHSDENGRPGVAIRYAFESPFGTTSYICMLCGLQISSNATDAYSRQLQNSFAADPRGTLEILARMQKRSSKLSRKLNRLGGPPPPE